MCVCVCVFECVGGCGVTVEVPLPLYFPSKMRWMVAINSRVTISRRVEHSRNKQQDAVTDESIAVFMFLCLLVCVCICVCNVLNKVCLGTLRPTESLQEAAIC